MDGSDCKDAQLRPRFRCASERAAAEFALRRTNWATQEARSVDERTARHRHHDQFRIFFTGGFGPWCGDAGRNRARNHIRNSTRACKSNRRVSARTQNLDPRFPNSCAGSFVYGMPKVAAVILAAGESSRFGQPKQLLQFRGETLLRRIIDAAMDADCTPIVVVVGNPDPQVRQIVAATTAVAVENKNRKRGIGTSIRVGVQRVIDNKEDVDAVVLLVSDQPFVDAGVIKQLIALYDQTKKMIVASSYADTLGVPALFDRSCFRELLVLDD